MKTQSEHYFGGCPKCGGTDGYMNVGRCHWFVCDAHKTKWPAGENLFSCWHDETEAVWRSNFEKLDGHTEVKPMPWRPTLRERVEQQWRRCFSRVQHWVCSIGKPKLDDEIPF